MTQVLARSGVRPALAAWWRPRLERIADWVADREIERRASQHPASVQAEARGAIALPRPGGVFDLVGRADRIDRRSDGSIVIIDYKTGIVPSRKAIEAGYASQLLLEAMMAEAGGFGPGLQGPPGDLIYWRLTGGAEAGAETRLFARASDDLAGEVVNARARLEELIDAFDQPDRPYLSQPNAAQAPRFADYALLARVAEWSAAGEDAAEGEDSAE
jgi:ATP-dependent helicase/nuclease subunit B